MKKIVVNDFNVFAHEIIEYCGDTQENVIIVGSYETISILFNILMKESDSQFISGELRSPDWDGYEDAYFLEYNEDEIWIGKARYEENRDYIYFDVNKVYVEKKYINDYAKVNKTNDIIVFTYDNYDELTNPCLCMNDDCTGFTYCEETEFGRSKFKYKGNKKLTEDEAWEIVDKYFE